MNLILSIIVFGQVLSGMPGARAHTLQDIEMGSCGWTFPWEVYEDWQESRKRFKPSLNPHARMSPVLQDLACVYICRTPMGLKIMASSQCEIIGLGALAQPIQVQVVN